MTNIVLLTRDPSKGGNNWVLAAEDVNPLNGAATRAVIWGKGRLNVKGTTIAEVENDFDAYVQNRKGTGYVEQVRVKVYFPLAKIVAFVKKVMPKLMKLAERVKIS